MLPTASSYGKFMLFGKKFSRRTEKEKSYFDGGTPQTVGDTETDERINKHIVV